ncbi:hypothetical protein TorRG33x02_114380 [Trema orientale]|uniref:Uncharacterized protein n=1 Tax=Trema orientale TaxID=63057 RepID=A0A2P5F4W8_TREOI|nr:hypothetical protein TorRG33x02_114380 [Trema orientale]
MGLGVRLCMWTTVGSTSWRDSDLGRKRTVLVFAYFGFGPHHRKYAPYRRPLFAAICCGSFVYITTSGSKKSTIAATSV